MTVPSISLRRSLAALALASLALAPSASADVIARPKPKDYVLGKGARIERAEKEAPRSVVLPEGATAKLELQVPAARAVEGLDPAGWWTRFEVDFELLNAGANLQFDVEWDGAVPGSTHGTLPNASEPGDKRIAWMNVAPGPAASSVTLNLQATAGAVRITAARLDRYHRAPIRKLLGKANGKLGPDRIGCGMLGFSAITEHDHTCFTVLGVRADGPAAEAGLRAGDLVTKIQGDWMSPSSIKPGWEWFERSHEARIGRAIEASLLDDSRSVRMQVARAEEDGWEDLEVTLQVPLKAELDDRFPLDGPLADALELDLIKWTVSHQKKNGTWPGTNAVNPALGALALLGTGDPSHMDAIHRSMEFLLKKNPRPSEMTGLAYWTVAFQGMLMCEYYLATGEAMALPWVKEAVAWLPTTTHECKWGMQAFGHGPSGLPYDNKALMAPTAHLLVFDALARKCGVESKVWEHVEDYVRHSWSNPELEDGHGAMGYNASYRDKGEFWSRTGLCALAEVLRGDDAGMAQTLCILMEERHPWMLNSHAYGEPGAALGLLALAVVKPEAYEAILPQWRWRFLCAWEPGYGLHYSTPHMGAPYLGEEAIVNLSYLLLASVRRGGLALSTVPEKR